MYTSFTFLHIFNMKYLLVDYEIHRQVERISLATTAYPGIQEHFAENKTPK